MVVVPSIGAAKHARKVADWGADAVIVQGGEGGGHTGGVATTLLLPSVLDAVDIPVIAAGGFFDGRGLAAALAYGAAGIAMGTRFLLTQESTVPEEVKRFYLGYGLDGTTVTTRVDGMPHRVLRTDLVRHLEESSRVVGLGHALRSAVRFRALTGSSWAQLVREGLANKRRTEQSWAQLVMAANTPMLLKAGLVDGDTAAGVLASGQVVGMLDDLPTCRELIEGTVAQAEEILAALAALPRTPLPHLSWSRIQPKSRPLRVGSGLSGRAGRAGAEQFDGVVDVEVAVPLGDLTGPALDHAALDLLGAPAPAADQVMVVALPGVAAVPVGRLALGRVDHVHDAGVDQRLQMPVDGGQPDRFAGGAQRGVHVLRAAETACRVAARRARRRPVWSRAAWPACAPG